VPDALRGPFIYTSPNAGEGILQNNDPPPNCAELVFHKNRLWYLNTRQPHAFDMQILAVGGASGIQDGDQMNIAGNVLRAKAVPAATGDYLLVTSGTTAFNIEQTALNLVSILNGLTSNTNCWAQYVSGPNDTPGKINIYLRSHTTAAFTVDAEPGAQRDCFSPQLLAGLHTMNLARVANVVTGTVTSGAQNFKVGESIVVAFASGTFGVGPFTVLSIGATTITYAEAGVNDTLAAQAVALASGPNSSPTSPQCTSVQEVKPNRAYYSKNGEFDAVPRTNFIDLGGQDADIVAGISANDQLWAWKRDGIIRLVGTDPSNFEPIDVDRTVVCNARETVVKFLGTPVGTHRPRLRAGHPLGVQRHLAAASERVPAARGRCGGCAPRAARLCSALRLRGSADLFFAGGKDIVTGTTLLCTNGYAYSAKANDWTEWSFDINVGNGNGKTCGVVLNGLLYFADRFNTSLEHVRVSGAEEPHLR
jgi:hypothetical protein